jgi:hypothetical protein
VASSNGCSGAGSDSFEQPIKDEKIIKHRMGE